MKETYKNRGIPLTVITKETVQAKKNRDNKNQKGRDPANSQQNDFLVKIKLSVSEPSPEYQSKDSNKV